MSREKFEAWGMSDVDLRITLESETYAGIAWMAWQAATASMQAERDQLAAECAALKSAFNPKHLPEDAIEILGETAKFDHDSNESGEWCWVDNEDEVIRAVLDVIRTGIETPATDRFLAEQRGAGGGYVNCRPQIRVDGFVYRRCQRLRRPAAQRGEGMSENEIKMALAKQLVIALKNLGAPVELLCVVGSYGDTQSDADVLEMLEQYNEKGSCMDVIIAPEFTWKPNPAVKHD